MKRFPLEVQVALENLEFWASVEVRRGDDLDTTLATFSELAEHVQACAEPGVQRILRHRLRSIRRLVELRCMSPVRGSARTYASPAARSTARAEVDESLQRSHAASPPWLREGAVPLQAYRH